jgi:hypothetical protein
MSVVFNFKPVENGINIPIKLGPYESTFYMFSPGETKNFVSQTNLKDVISVDDKTISGTATNNGAYYSTIKSGGQETTKSFTVSGIPAPYNVSGIWEMTLEGKQFPKISKNITSLQSWTEQEETRHFSGTGKYEISFDLPAEYVNPELELLLDPGKIGEIAELTINGKNAGIIWMRGQKSEISGLVKPGINKLEIWVTNLLINQVSAMKEPNPVPEELVPVYGSAPTPTPGNTPREFGFQPLPASGLMGPVIIIPVKMVSVSF